MRRQSVDLAISPTSSYLPGETNPEVAPVEEYHIGPEAPIDVATLPGHADTLPSIPARHSRRQDVMAAFTLIATLAAAGIAISRPDRVVSAVDDIESEAAISNSQLGEITRAEYMRQYSESRATVQHTPFTGRFTTPELVGALGEARNQHKLLANKQSSYLSDPSSADSQANNPAHQVEKSKQELASLEKSYRAAELADLEDPRLQARLESMKAKFKAAVRTSSGIEINFYESGFDDGSKSWNLDPKAWDILISQFINQADLSENNPYGEGLEELQNLASQGKLNLRLNAVIITNEDLCFTGGLASNGGLVNTLPEVRGVQTCAGIGYNDRHSEPGTPALNQFIVALNTVGDTSSQDPEASSNRKVGLDSGYRDRQLARIGFHEVAHALLARTSNHATASIDDEHRVIDPWIAGFLPTLESLTITPDTKKGKQVSLPMPVHIVDRTAPSVSR